MVDIEDLFSVYTDFSTRDLAFEESLIDNLLYREKIITCYSNRTDMQIMKKVFCLFSLLYLFHFFMLSFLCILHLLMLSLLCIYEFCYWLDFVQYQHTFEALYHIKCLYTVLYLSMLAFLQRFKLLSRYLLFII